jgi:uncharacterized membrane protein YqiK
VLSSEQINLQIKLALIQALPSIIEKSVEPMKQIEGIKIVQVDGLNRGHAGNGASSEVTGGGSLAEQAVAAALAYRAQSPIIDGLLKEIGMTGGTLGGLTQAAVTGMPITNVEAKKAIEK